MRVWAGTSASAAERVRLRTCPSVRVWSGITARTGAVLTSVTETVKEPGVVVTPSETETWTV